MPSLSSDFQDIYSYHLSATTAKRAEPWSPEQAPTRCKHFPVIRLSNPYRFAWNLIVAGAIVYTATALLFVITFLDFGVPKPKQEPGELHIINVFLNSIFITDVFVNFFLSYRNNHGWEVLDPVEIAKHYVRTYFFFDLIAIIPESLLHQILSSQGLENAQKATKLARLQRVTKLQYILRLTRVVRLSRVAATSPWWTRVSSIRTARILNFIGLLIFVLHLLACGWFLCATVCATMSDTNFDNLWVSRRYISESKTLLDVGPLEQWVHSMYFVLTVFTTVGFGDIFPVHPLEIAYTSFVMITGAVMHSIIIGEIINIVTHEDNTAIEHHRKKDLVAAFAAHTKLSNENVGKFQSWLEFHRGERHVIYDRGDMQELLMGGLVPRELLELLPGDLFQGKLVRNKFLTLCVSMPSRLPLLVAIHIKEHTFAEYQLVYRAQDPADRMYIVTDGTFAHVAHSEDISMKSMLKHVSASSRVVPYKLVCHGNYFGDYELHTRCGRLSTVRCESKAGTVLIYPRAQLHFLMREFPECARPWKQEAIRRENRRYVLAQQAKHEMSSCSLAARSVQKLYRFRRHSKRGSMELVPSAAKEITPKDHCSIGIFCSEQDSNPDLTTSLAYDSPDLLNIVNLITEIRSEQNLLHEKLDKVILLLKESRPTMHHF